MRLRYLCFFSMTSGLYGIICLWILWVLSNWMWQALKVTPILLKYQLSVYTDLLVETSVLYDHECEPICLSHWVIEYTYHDFVSSSKHEWRLENQISNSLKVRAVFKIWILEYNFKIQISWYLLEPLFSSLTVSKAGRKCYLHSGTMYTRNWYFITPRCKHMDAN